MVNAWLAPQFTTTSPTGSIVPPAPAEAVMVKVLSTKLAAMVWSAWTLVKV